MYFIQSNYGNKGNFEVVLVAPWSLYINYWRENDTPGSLGQIE